MSLYLYVPPAPASGVSSVIVSKVFAPVIMQSKSPACFVTLKSPKVFPPPAKVTLPVRVLLLSPMSMSGALETVKPVVVSISKTVPVRPLTTIFPPPAVSFSSRVLVLEEEKMLLVRVWPLRSRAPWVRVKVPPTINAAVS